MRRHPSRPRVEVGSLADDPVAGEVVVSTVPASAQDDRLLPGARGVPVVFEVRYDPWPTPLAAATAASRGQVLVGGLDLLVHQAAPAVHALHRPTRAAGGDAPRG